MASKNWLILRLADGMKHPAVPDPMPGQEPIELEGTVTQVLPGTLFRVALPDGHEVLAHVSREMKKRFIRISVGDSVKVKRLPHDSGKARITLRQG